MLSSKRRKVSKRNKSSWRKNIDIKDVDEFLDEQRLEERLGGPLDSKKDEELFVIDKKGDTKKELKLSKKQRAALPPKCLKILEPSSAVPDPIIKRNRVRTKEERKHPFKKRDEAVKRAKGIIPRHVIEARKQRALTYLKKKQQPKELVFQEDIWNNENQGNNENMDWLSKDTVRHTLTNTRRLKVPVPLGVQKKKSILPTIERPHPGISYNPTYKDHQELLKAVADRELNAQKEEAHLTRVTTEMFSKVSPHEKEKNWIEEMSQGLIKSEKDDDEKPSLPLDEYKAINPPTNFEKKKTLKQRRKQREEKKAALLRKERKIEKKKVADLYKLKFLNKEVEETEEQHNKIREKKSESAKLKEVEPKRLGMRKFSAPDIEFTRGCDIRGNLRSMKPVGNLLADRFYSFQKRNILVPSVKQTKFKKAKVKRYTKPSYKTDEENVTKKKRNKQ